MEPSNKIFTEAHVTRIREFAAQNQPTTSRAIADILASEFALFLEEQQVEGIVKRQKISLGGQPANPLRERPEIIARIRQMIETGTKYASNAMLVRLAKTEFDLDVTEGQVAAALHREGLSRGGPVNRRPKDKITADVPTSVPTSVPLSVSQALNHEQVRHSFQRVDLVPKQTLATRPTVVNRPVMPRPVTVPRTCQWPTGDGPITFECTTPVHSGRPYCVEHCRDAFVGFHPHRPAERLTLY